MSTYISNRNSAFQDFSNQEAPEKPTFQDGAGFAFEFESNWKKEKEFASTEIQTDAPTEAAPERATQAPERLDQEVQTDEIKLNLEMVADNSPALKTFLTTIYPIVERQLLSNVKSRAFKGYSVQWEDEVHTISCVYELYPTPEFTPNTSSISATGVAWSSNGSTIAASYGKLDHEGWCVHGGSLCAWNVFRRKMDPKQPDIVLDTPNCLMCVEFHPSEPTLLAGGTFNGQLFIWDLAKPDDPLLVTSGFSDETHYESITRIVWLKEASGRRTFRLVTIGTEGKVLLWELTIKPDFNSKLEMISPMVLSLKSKGGSMIPTGGTAMSFNNSDETVFIVGTESGRLFKASLTSGKENSKDKKPVNPLQFAYEPHAGPVYSVDCSPYHRNLFLSTGVDTHIRLYSLLKKNAVIDLVPSQSYLFCLQWSPFRPALFAAGGGDGKIYFYDLRKNKFKPTVTLEISSASARSQVQALKFNPKIREYFASGDSRGVVKIWQLNQYLTQEDSQERYILTTLGGPDAKLRPLKPGEEVTPDRNTEES